MNLSWSHAVINVRDLEKMLEFYSTVLGFEVSDRGPLGPDMPEIVFLSNNPDEHHQIAMVSARQGDTAGNPLNHLAFRVEGFDDVKTVHQRLTEREMSVMPLSHGNTLSVYFGDPEGNGLEVFWDTPWHVAQPQGKPWDPSLSQDEALAWVEENFSSEPSFTSSEALGVEFANRLGDK